MSTLFFEYTALYGLVICNKKQVTTSHFVSFCITFESKYDKVIALHPNEFFCGGKSKNRKYSDIRPLLFKWGNRVSRFSIYFLPLALFEPLNLFFELFQTIMLAL